MSSKKQKPLNLEFTEKFIEGIDN